MGDDKILDEDLADVKVLRHDAAVQGVGLVDEDDLHWAVVAGRTTGLVNLNTGPMVKFLNKINLILKSISKYFLSHVENLGSRLGEESWADEVRVAATAAVTEGEAAGGEDEVPAELLEVHLHLVHTAGLGSGLLALGRANIPGSSAVTFPTLELELVLNQILLSGSSYDLPWSAPELLPEPLEDVLRPEDSQLLAGQVLREQEGRGEREEEDELSHHYHDLRSQTETQLTRNNPELIHFILRLLKICILLKRSLF